ncbi:MAG: hypothetical protein IRZ06_10125 [Nevskia sp.]|nr:hypothetical protein [Nevskia sp.]
MSVVNRIVSRLTWASRPIVGGSNSPIVPQDGWDVFIDKLPFMVSPTPDFPFRVKSIGQTLYRYDTSNQPGEQTLGAWWLRSQSSFHGGAGQDVLDGNDPTISQDVAALRFADCRGVDVWTPGQVGLLPRTRRLAAVGSGALLLGVQNGSTPLILWANGATLWKSDGTTTTQITWGGSDQIKSLTQDGSNWYAASPSGIYTGPLSGSTGSRIYDTSGVPGSDSVVIAWAKQRLMACVGASVYELSSAGGALPQPKFTHPNSGWVWTALADGPEAIYCAGWVGSESVVYKFVLDGSGQVPTLTTGISAVRMPPGERVLALANHTDSWLVLGTSLGLRVGEFRSGGDVALPLLWNDVGGACTGLAPWGRFVYCNYHAADGVAGIARVDLSMSVKDGLFAWAPDLTAFDSGADVTGVATSVAMLGSEPAFVVDGVGVFIADSTPVASGWLRTSRIRFDTSEPKIFASVKWAGSGNGSVQCSFGVNSDSGPQLGSLGLNGAVDYFEAPVLQAGGSFCQITFTLSGGSPQLMGYVLKALPQQPRAYQIMLPLSCFDREKLRTGRVFGHVGWGLERLNALMGLADETSAHYMIQVVGDARQRHVMRVVIDDIDFVQSTPPAGMSGGGGLAYVTLRTV